MPTDNLTPAQRQVAVANLLEWMRVNTPNAYLGLVQRFAPPGGLGAVAVLDSLKNAASGVVNAATNFVSSQGFQNLVNQALPFLANSQQRANLDQQAKLAQSGFTTINAQGVPAVVPIASVVPPSGGVPVPGTSMFSTSTGSVNWSAIAPWALGAGGLLLFALSSRGSRR